MSLTESMQKSRNLRISKIAHLRFDTCDKKLIPANIPHGSSVKGVNISLVKFYMLPITCRQNPSLYILTEHQSDDKHLTTTLKKKKFH